MNRFLMGVLVTLGIGVSVGAGVVYSGGIDVSADTPHSPLVHRLFEVAREQSIDNRTRDIATPANLSDVERVRRGAGNYAAMCVECHLAPGKANTEIRKGLYPAPPDLSQPAKTQSDAAGRQFWIIKHGIKASGMPAWSKGGIEDEAIWDIVAFLQKMPSLSAEQYGELVESSEGHSHGGIMGGSHSDGDMHGEAPTQDHHEKPMPVVVSTPHHDPTDGHTH